jgi:hypothetical protein
MVNDLLRLALGDSHVQRGEHQVSGHLLADRPADDTAAPHVQHDSQKDEARPRRNIRQVGHP